VFCLLKKPAFLKYCERSQPGVIGDFFTFPPARTTPALALLETPNVSDRSSVCVERRFFSAADAPAARALRGRTISQYTGVAGSS
jgi:hypothetical protein